MKSIDEKDFIVHEVPTFYSQIKIKCVFVLRDKNKNMKEEMKRKKKEKNTTGQPKKRMKWAGP
jgi:hypothetical protein